MSVEKFYLFCNIALDNYNQVSYTACERIDKSNVPSRTIARLKQPRVAACKTTACMLVRFLCTDTREPRHVEMND